MADEVEFDAEPAGGEELRACAFCGAMIHPASTRCSQCGGHVGLAWGTAHKEHFLFLFTSVLILVGCIVPWVPRWPAVATLKPEDAAMLASPAGLATLRGPFMFALALYGVVASLVNVFNRRMTMWPFVLNGFLALWVGLQGVSRAAGSGAVDAWKKEFEKHANFLDSIVGPVRAIPPGFVLLSLAGVLIVITLLKGIVAGSAASRAKEKAKREESASRFQSRRRGGEAPPAETPPPEGTNPPPTV